MIIVAKQHMHVQTYPGISFFTPFISSTSDLHLITVKNQYPLHKEHLHEKKTR